MELKNQEQYRSHVRIQIQALLQWTEVEYGEFQMHQGEAWLEHWLGKDAYGIKYLVTDRMFWRWWINHWDARDADFITYARRLPLAERRGRYQALNSPELLNKRPHKCVLEDSYARMMGELLDAKNHSNDLSNA